MPFPLGSRQLTRIEFNLAESPDLPDISAGQCLSEVLRSLPNLQRLVLHLRSIEGVARIVQEYCGRVHIDISLSFYYSYLDSPAAVMGLQELLEACVLSVRLEALHSLCALAFLGGPSSAGEMCGMDWWLPYLPHPKSNLYACEFDMGNEQLHVHLWHLCAHFCVMQTACIELAVDCLHMCWMSHRICADSPHVVIKVVWALHKKAHVKIGQPSQSQPTREL